MYEKVLSADEATALTKSGYNFTLTNTGKVDSAYSIYVDDVTPNGETKERIADSLIWVNITNTTTNDSHTYKLSELGVDDTASKMIRVFKIIVTVLMFYFFSQLKKEK